MWSLLSFIFFESHIPTNMKTDRAMDTLRIELRQAEARAAEAEVGRTELAAEMEGMEARLRAAVASAAAAAAAAAKPPSPVPMVVVGGGLGGELKKLQAELRATKARLDTAQTNQTLLQRYIAVRRLGSGAGEGGESAVLLSMSKGEGAEAVAAAAGPGVPVAAAAAAVHEEKSGGLGMPTN